MNTTQKQAMNIQTIMDGGLVHCTCGREHTVPDTRIMMEADALAQLPAQLRALGVAEPYLVMDGNTRQAVGNRVMHLLDEAGICFKTCCLATDPRPQADMETLNILARAMDNGCDFVLGIGSGVLNDLCKMLGKQTGLSTGIIATAPSMDGYASNSSAMIVGGVKTTIYNQTPVLVVCDPGVLQNAPETMRGAGIGDMAAKVISIAEWRISRLVTGEYYCEAIADMMLNAYRQAVDGAAAVMRGDAQAVRELTEGLVLSGIASSMAQVSRPASGSEHTLSHLMDMFSIARGTEHNLHGVQVGYGVRVVLAAYEAFLETDDPMAFAGDVIKQHRQAVWERDMQRVFGAQADALIRTAQQEGRNTGEALCARSAAAAAHLQEIRAILQGVVDHQEPVLTALDAAGIPQLSQPEQLGISPEDALDIFVHAKDLRSRYIFPALLFDLGLLPWMRDRLMGVLGIAKDRKRYFDEV